MLMRLVLVLTVAVAGLTVRGEAADLVKEHSEDTKSPAVKLTHSY